MNRYQEQDYYGNKYREAYLEGIQNLLRARQEEALFSRNKYAEGILTEPDRYRSALKDMLGWPLKEAEKYPVLSLKKEFVARDDLAGIYRLRIEVLPDLWFYGLLFTVDENSEKPLVIAQHGGQGTPEMCSGFFDSANYNDMTIRILKQGVNVFAPQLLLWERPRFGSDFDRINLDMQLKQAGSSISAVEIFCIQKSIDYLSTLPYVKKESIGMIGLSYGGFYTLYTAAVDTRIKAALSACYLNDRLRYNWNDWTWFNSANTFLDSEVGALICPRWLRVELGQEDELFDYSSARTEIERLKNYYGAFSDRLQIQGFPGKHELCKSDEGIRFVTEHLV